MEQNDQEYNIVIEDGVLKQFDKEYEGEYVVPSSITAIEHHAFIECEELTGIVIPASVTSIGELAFNGCGKLEHISVDEDNPVYDSRENCCAIIETASDTLVQGCVNTRIPDSVRRIGKHAYDSTWSLKTIIIPDSVKVIEDWAFSNCYELRYIYLPESVVEIGMAAFYECESLKEITLPDSLKVLGDGAFCRCVSLNNVHFPASVSFVKGEDRLLSGCDSLKSISIDARNRLFDSRGGCNAIIETAYNRLTDGCENTIIPNTIESIADRAFSSTDIMAVIIPESVKHLGNHIFDSCEMLSHIVVNKNNPVYDSREDCNAIIKSSTNTLIYGCKNSVIPNSVTTIADSAFYGCSGLTTIEIPDSVRTLREYAFGHCVNLTKVHIPDSVKYIDPKAFIGCTELTLSIPENCEYSPDDFRKVKKVVRRKAKNKK